MTAAVLLERGWRPNKPLKDSKKLTALNREKWFRVVKKTGLPYATSRISPSVVDRLNVTNAANRSAARSFNRLVAKLELSKKDVNVYLDGGLYLGGRRSQKLGGWMARTLIKGDEKINAVKLASIIAKVSRDRYMVRLDRMDSRYGFRLHKGYGTRRHRTLIRKYGPSENHRLTFLSKTISIYNVKHATSG